MTPTKSGQKTPINPTGIFLCATILSGWVALNAAPPALAAYLSLPPLHPAVASLATPVLLASAAATFILGLLGAFSHKPTAAQVPPHP